LEAKTKNLLIILGPTSVGKSKTAIKLAKIFEGEIINCDSMQVYKGFDIGTDKVPLNERQGIAHHLLDIIPPSKQFTAADFVHLALDTAQNILSRNKLPIIVGGTGLYLKALLDGLFPEGKSDPALRFKLRQKAAQQGLKELWHELQKVDPVYSQKISPNDQIRIIRALEVYYATQKPISEHFLKTESPVKDFHILKIGLKLKKEELYARIDKRVDKMFEKGIVTEVQNLLQSGVREDSLPFRALGYKHVLHYLRGELTLEEAVELTKRDTRHYAKRQMTWFRKMKGISWFPPHEISSIINFIKNNLK